MYKFSNYRFICTMLSIINFCFIYFSMIDIELYQMRIGCFNPGQHSITKTKRQATTAAVVYFFFFVVSNKY